MFLFLLHPHVILLFDSKNYRYLYKVQYYYLFVFINAAGPLVPFFFFFCADAGAVGILDMINQTQIVEFLSGILTVPGFKRLIFVFIIFIQNYVFFSMVAIFLAPFLLNIMSSAEAAVIYFCLILSLWLPQCPKIWKNKTHNIDYNSQTDYAALCQLPEQVTTVETADEEMRVHEDFEISPELLSCLDLASGNIAENDKDGKSMMNLHLNWMMLRGKILQIEQHQHQDAQEKKDAQGLFNNVIEETASKLVKALVGAFETCIQQISPWFFQTSTSL
ncbi:hypothetical protein ACJX0J_038744, partial [Zea mays]